MSEPTPNTRFFTYILPPPVAQAVSDGRLPYTYLSALQRDGKIEAGLARRVLADVHKAYYRAKVYGFDDDRALIDALVDVQVDVEEWLWWGRTPRDALKTERAVDCGRVAVA